MEEKMWEYLSNECGVDETALRMIVGINGSLQKTLRDVLYYEEGGYLFPWEEEKE